MSFELRLKRLKAKWTEIQELRGSQQKNRKIMQKAQKEVRRIAQELPKKLNEYNEMMV